MKKLGKLNINSSKVIKNEELIALKGGYGGGDCHCMCYTGDPIPRAVGLMAAFDMAECIDNCHAIDPSYGHTFNCLY
jgi:natural product precursor